MGTNQQAGDALVQITVLQGKNLNNKNVPLLNFLRAEFNGTVLGDSKKMDAVMDESVNYNFTCSFVCSESAHTLDDLAHKPVIFTVIKLLPGDKKHKEEKTSVLGQAVVDLLPLLQGQSSFSSSTDIHLVPSSLTESVLQDKGVKPTLEVEVSVLKPLLSDAQLSNSNLLMVTVEMAFSVPEVWNPASGPHSGYVAALQVPVTAKREQTLWFSHGVLKMGGEKEPAHRPKKWPLSALLAPNAQFIPGIFTEDRSIDLEDGDLNGIEDREFREEAEYKSKRVCWDMERRCFLDAGGVACLTRRIAECRLWPVEIMRSPLTEASKTAAGKVGKDKPQVEDDIPISFHGVAYVDFGPLLYPGTCCIRGAYRLYPFYDSDLLNKTKRDTSVLRSRMKVTAAQGRAHSSNSTKVAFRKDSMDAPKKTGTQGRPNQSEDKTDGELQVNPEGQVTLKKPLVPKRPSEELTKRVKELIPSRPLLPQQPTRAERAVHEYHAQIANVTAQIVGKYQQMFGTEPLDPVNREQRKTQFFGELNCSGQYFAFKEQMKNSVVRIARDNMLRTEAFRDTEEKQAFLSQLYIFLVDEMHVALNKTLSGEIQEPQTQPLLDCQQLRHFAKEAELNEDYPLAAQYYQEQLARDQHSPSHWFDYGIFYMLTEDYLKAEECFHLALSLSQSHTSSLLMCGILSEMNRRCEDAETFFESATCVEPGSVVAWTVLGLFYQAQKNLIQAERAFREANKQLKTGLVPPTVCRDDNSPACPEDIGKEKEGISESLTVPVNEPAAEGDSETEARPQSCQVTDTAEGYMVNADPEAADLQQHESSTTLSTTIYMETVKFLLQNHALQMAQRALSQELLCAEGRPSSSYLLALVHMQLRKGEYSSAKDNLQEVLQDEYQNPDTWALYGHLHFLMRDYEEAKKCYERTLDFDRDCSDTHPVYLHLGSIYLQSRQYNKAKLTYIQACKRSPSCLTWLGLGISCYRLGELTEAEDALTEANTLNNKNPEVWGYLSLVNLQTGRRYEAEQSFKYALKCNLKEETLLQEIEELQACVGLETLHF